MKGRHLPYALLARAIEAAGWGSLWDRYWFIEIAQARLDEMAREYMQALAAMEQEQEQAGSRDDEEEAA